MSETALMAIVYSIAAFISFLFVHRTFHEGHVFWCSLFIAFLLLSTLGALTTWAIVIIELLST